MNIRFGSILTDPERREATVLMSGCPLRCAWCFSGELVTRPEQSGEEEETRFVRSLVQLRANADTVIFTGGEPLAQGNALRRVCEQLRHAGFRVKIETSGFYAEALRDLLPFVHAVAIDVKTKLEPSAYAKIARFTGDPELLVSNVLRSLVFLETWKGGFTEARTTLVPGENDSEDAIADVARHVRFADVYVLQELQSSATFVQPDYAFRRASKERIWDLARHAKKNHANVRVRFAEGEFPVLNDNARQTAQTPTASPAPASVSTSTRTSTSRSLPLAPNARAQLPAPPVLLAPPAPSPPPDRPVPERPPEPSEPQPPAPPEKPTEPEPFPEPDEPQPEEPEPSEPDQQTDELVPELPRPPRENPRA